MRGSGDGLQLSCWEEKKEVSKGATEEAGVLPSSTFSGASLVKNGSS